VGLPLGALTLTAAAVATAAGAAVARHAVPTHPAPIAGVVLSTQAPSAAATTTAQPAAPQAWIELVGIERGISGAQDTLAQQETAIARLARVVAAHHPDPDGLSPTTGGAAMLDATNALTALVAAHDATQAALHQSLAAEYTLYRTAAGDPQKRAQLIEAAAGAKAPAIAQAVTYNLSQVDTQLSQEAAIAAAEKKLGSFGGLSAAQLEAIRRGQPFIAPEAGSVVQGFGPTDLGLEPPYTYHGTFFPHFHTGVDIAAPLGTPIHAAADGVVALAATSVDAQGKPAGYGTYVVIAHPDGFYTLYAHMDSVAVTAGQVVRQGQVIGIEGSTGNSTGPHVHFEIRHGNDLVDPATLLKGQLHS
jgi:murein DD-endopeptidase MepM/ murein hydrolase activator NlpD